MIARRSLIASAGAALFPHLVNAQGPRVRLGYLSGGRQDENKANTLGTLLPSLASLGWSPGDNLAVDERWTDGDAALFPQMANELVALRPNILVATGATETKSLMAATQTIPIVFCQISADPVAIGIVNAITRPGKNVTGFMQAPQILWGKRIEFLTAFMGNTPRQLAWIGNPSNYASNLSWADAQKAAGAFGSTVVRIPIGSVNEIENAIASAKNCDALLVQFDYLLAVHRHQVAEAVAKLGIPAIYENRSQVAAGGLMSYGGDLRDNYREAAKYIDRILKGSSPAELPVVQASRFELVINVKAAQRLGRSVPAALLARADETIE